MATLRYYGVCEIIDTHTSVCVYFVLSIGCVNNTSCNGRI